jgi:hypothetical protein
LSEFVAEPRHTPIRAAISGHDTCCAEGITAKASAPVLAICRKLVEAGHDSVRPLHAYRGDTLCLTVSSIGRGARYSVKDNACGTPSLRRYEGALAMSAAPYDVSVANAAHSTHPDTEAA